MGEDDSQYGELLRKAPDWCAGVIIYNGTAYPLAKSKFRRGEFYFSTSWRPLAKDLGSRDVVVLKDGRVSRYRISRRSDKYLQVVLT